ncbi:MAG: branched-chain amino acid ABC transporter permease [Rhodospirillaceae bacterium]|jgi:branched-chain amino acid transport system permease protein|nr:branched-chain amino acid ABC transporter permease [Rhodospirillaceae bacterium]
MDGALTLQLLLNALALGAAYGLVALGFALVIGATGAVNFAQGDLVMAGGFLTVALASLLPVDGLLLLPLVVLAMAGLGLAVCAVAYLPFRNAPPVSVFVSTIAIGIMLQNGANGLFGAAPRAGPPLLSGGGEPGGLDLDRQSLAVIAAAVLLAGGTWLMLYRTQLGRRMRATAQDPEMARAMGVNTTRTIALTFALATALAGAAGLLLSNRYFVTPVEGSNLMLKAYIAVVVGGWGRIGGALAGALLVAGFEVIVSAVLSYPVAEAGLYICVLLLLLLRPQGLFGEALGRRV